MRPYLLWISAGAEGPASNIITTNRLYDVFYHGYSDLVQPLPVATRLSEYYIRKAGEKLNVAATNMPPDWHKYQMIAFLDDDLTITTEEINRLFVAGHVLRLPLYQPSLADGSFSSHHFLTTNSDLDLGVRLVPFVEIMCPFFSRAALLDCLPTFDINQSGWGLDCYLWPKIVKNKCYVMDGIKVGHYRQPARRARILRNGLTPMQELWIQQKINDPRKGSVEPPGYKRPITAEDVAP